MNKPTRILTAIFVSLAVGGMFAYQDAQKHDVYYQAHPLTVILTDFFGASLSGFIFYFGSGWLAKRKERNYSKRGGDKFYDEVARELQEKTLVAGLWTKAFAETGGDDAKARALYIKYRVAQLAEASWQELEKNQIAKQQQEKQKRFAANAVKEQQIAAIESAKRLARTRTSRLIYMMIACFCGLVTISFILIGLGAPFVQDNTFEEKTYIPIFSFFTIVCFGLVTRYCFNQTRY